MRQAQQILVQNSKVLQNIKEIGAALAILSDTGSAGRALALKYEITINN